MAVGQTVSIPGQPSVAPLFSVPGQERQRSEMAHKSFWLELSPGLVM